MTAFLPARNVDHISARASSHCTYCTTWACRRMPYTFVETIFWLLIFNLFCKNGITINVFYIVQFDTSYYSIYELTSLIWTTFSWVNYQFVKSTGNSKRDLLKETCVLYFSNMSQFVLFYLLPHATYGEKHKKHIVLLRISDVLRPACTHYDALVHKQ
jgi:hypothetical protein